MPVARATTSAISSAPTCVRSSRGALVAPLLDSLSWVLELLLQLGQLAVLQLGDLVEVALALQFLDLETHLVDGFHDLGAALGLGLFGLPDLVVVGDFLLQLGDLFLDQAEAFDRGLVLLAAHGFALDLELDQPAVEPVHDLGLGVAFDGILLAASSIRSMALSGRKRSVM
jgi:hypothetical protein